MIDNQPILKLDYLPPDKQPRKQWPLLIYFLAAFLGSIAGAIIAGLVSIICDAIKPMSPGPGDELGIGIIWALIIWAVLIAIASFVASCIFRLCCGWVVRGTRRWVATAGALNGLIGMGILVGSFMLMDRHLLGDSHLTRNIIIGTNIALPVIMGIITANKPTY